MGIFEKLRYNYNILKRIITNRMPMVLKDSDKYKIVKEAENEYNIHKFGEPILFYNTIEEAEEAFAILTTKNNGQRQIDS